MKNFTKEKVTFVLTSCGRLDLLEKTINSFLKYNSYPIERYIIVEDSGNHDIRRQLEERYSERFEILFNEPKLGQIRSIDRAYSQVITPFIFHCEDDWEFYRGGFIENSMSVLNLDPMIIQVWLREVTDTNSHPVEKEVYATDDKVAYRKMVLDYAMKRGSKTLNWHGFSFNPGVKRMVDYAKISSYSSVGEREIDISQKYRELGYYATILEHGAVKHIGWGRHTVPYETVKQKNLMSKIIAKFHSYIVNKNA